MRKKALIITYYWPPAGGPGVQRWLKFVKYLPDFGIDPIVYIPENPSYPLIDKSLLKDVSDDVTIIKQAINEPYKFAKILSKKTSKTVSKGIISEAKKQNVIERLMLFVRGNFFIPDARVGWVEPSVAYLQTYITDYHINTIITTGPPHSLHLIGLKLQKLLGVKWIADFRDPWTTIGYHKDLRLLNKAQDKHKTLEKKVLQSADHIIVTSDVTKQEFKTITQQPISVITNGFDITDAESPMLDKKFTMAHIGSLLSKRNPEILWQVLKELIDENPDFAKDFEFHFVGTVSEDVLKSAYAYSLSHYINKHGYLHHNKAIEFQKKTQLLLLIEIDSEETRCIIPGKLFEYMVSERPILALGPKASDVEHIIKETNTGSYFYYDAHESLKNTILGYYEQYRAGMLKSHAIGLQKYSRKALTQVLSELI